MKHVSKLSAPALLLALSACSGNWVPDMPDFSGWFDRENEARVDELFNHAQCNAPGDAPALQLLPDAQAVKAWERGRGIDLSGDMPLPSGPYVAVDLGQRPSGGYGIAVSRQAGLKDGILVLKATFFAPAADAMNTQALTSPCAIVRLPQVSFGSLRLIDQTGKQRASTGGFTSAQPAR